MHSKESHVHRKESSPLFYLVYLTSKGSRDPILEIYLMNQYRISYLIKTRNILCLR